MTSENIKIWLIAVIKQSLPDAIVERWGPELPATEGVFIDVPSERPIDRSADTCEIRIRVAAIGEAACWTRMKQVDAAIDRFPGDSRQWSVSPQSKNLRLKSITRTSSISPQREGELADLYISTILFEAVGSASA